MENIIHIRIINLKGSVPLGDSLPKLLIHNRYLWHLLYKLYHLASTHTQISVRVFYVAISFDGSREKTYNIIVKIIPE